jgi:hypothetical protein
VISRLTGELKQVLFTSSYIPDDQINHFFCQADNLALSLNLKINSRGFWKRWLSSESTKKSFLQLLLKVSVKPGERDVATMKSMI